MEEFVTEHILTFISIIHCSVLSFLSLPIDINVCASRLSKSSMYNCKIR